MNCETLEQSFNDSPQQIRQHTHTLSLSLSLSLSVCLSLSLFT